MGAAPSEEATEATAEAAFGRTRKKKREEAETFRTIDTSEIVYVYLDLPLVMSMKILPIMTQSCVMRTLQSKGVANIATVLATGSPPLAGCVAHFKQNWEAIIQDCWVLETIKGYMVEFLRKPCQNHKPPQITFTKEGEE